MARIAQVFDDVLMLLRGGKMVIADDTEKIVIPAQHSTTGKRRSQRVDVAAEGKKHLQGMFAEVESETEAAKAAETEALAQAEKALEEAVAAAKEQRDKAIAAAKTACENRTARAWVKLNELVDGLEAGAAPRATKAKAKPKPVEEPSPEPEAAEPETAPEPQPQPEPVPAPQPPQQSPWQQNPQPPRNW